MARLYMIFSVNSDAHHNDLMGIRQVVFDRLRGAFIRPKLYQGELAELVADERAIDYARNDGNSDYSPRGKREATPAVVAYGDLLGRTRLALSMYDHLTDTGADIQYERWSATMADLLDEWAGPID